MRDANLIVDRRVCRAESHIASVDVGHKLSFTHDNTDTEHHASVRVVKPKCFVDRLLHVISGPSDLLTRSNSVIR